MTRWLPQWFGCNPRPQPCRRRSASLRVEQLEDRRVAAIVVDTLADGQFAFLTSLREAIDAANVNTDADVITFAPGLFVPGVASTIQLDAELPVLATDIDVQGPGADLLTVRRNTGGDYRIFTVAANTTVTLSGLTITDGNAVGPTPASDGGGILNGGTLTVSNCTLVGNTALGEGGGIQNTNTGVLMLNHCTLSSNTADDGGGISSYGMLTLNHSTLSANSARFGGGISNGGTLQLTNSTLSGNQASLFGGGLFTGDATLTNATLTANGADSNDDGNGSGGGIHRVGGTLTLHNTIVAGNFKGSQPNTRDDIIGDVASGSSFNLIGDGTGLTAGIISGVNGNLVGLDPRLGPLLDNGGPTKTHALLPGSPAINRGLFAGALVTDQRGALRSGAPDIGAFEFIPSPVAPARALVAALVNKKLRNTRRLFIRVSFADTGVLKIDVRSPFQRPGYRAIAIALLDSNGDGVPDAVQLTARKGTRTFTRLFAV